MNTFITKAVAELREKFYLPKGIEGWSVQATITELSDFLTQKLQQLAKQKDEEFMKLLDKNAVHTTMGRIVQVDLLRNKVKKGTG